MPSRSSSSWPVILERGGLIAEIYEMVHQWLGWLKGGVAIASVAACTMMAAMVGVIGASEVTMGVIAFPGDAPEKIR